MKARSSRACEAASAPTLAEHGQSLTLLLRQCEGFCGDASKRVDAAALRLDHLSVRFVALAETLDTGDMFAATWNLDLVAQEIRAVGMGLSGESDRLEELTALNRVLSRRVTDLDDDVRLLVAMVSNAKVELASIDAHGESLEGFGQTLEDLATKAKRTLKTYQATHETLLMELRRTAKMRGGFELTHRGKLAAMADEIDASVSMYRSRHKTIAGAAGDIAQTSRAAGERAAQIGQALRADQAALSAIDGSGDPPDEKRSVEDLCLRQADRLGQAAPGLKADLVQAEAQLMQLAARVTGLANPTNPLVLSSGEVTTSFLSDLDPKLRRAEVLIRQCRESRAAFDGTASTIVSTFEELQTMAAQMTAMVVDMTIVGTNAIVKSFRLGQRGAGLSIIAQHLRGHSLKIADGIGRLTPAMADARGAAEAFTSALEAQDTARITALGERTAEVVDAFARVGAQAAQAMHDLKSEAVSLGDVLRGAAAELAGSLEAGAALDQAAQAIGPLSKALDLAGGDEELPIAC